MQICVLIGNGFDLALGLATDYQSFIDKYQADNASSKDESVRWLCNKIKEKRETWGDAEIAFGEIEFEDIETYSSIASHFSSSLLEYLKEQNARFRISKSEQGKTRESLLASIMSIDNWMMPGHKQYCKFSNEQNDIFIDFLTFNYTNTLEQLLEYSETARCDAVIKDSEGNERKIIVKNICHVHGTLAQGALFGVDSQEQIKSRAIRDYCSNTGGILKERSSEMAGLTNRIEGVGRISSADVIITYGLSFGASDRSWWRRIWDGVVQNGKAQLIVCPFDTKGIPAVSSGPVLNEFFANQKRRVFRSIGEKDAAVVSLMPKQFISLMPCLVDGKAYDYFHLSTIRGKDGM